MIRGGREKMDISSMEVVMTNIDLLVQILLWLPPRSLLRFRCVCKQWLSLISEPQFQYDHARQYHNHSASGLYTSNLDNCLSIPLLQGHYRSLPSLTFLEQIGDLKDIKIVHSCNGLILCLVHNSILFEDGFKSVYVHQIIVCNPTTQKCKLLPTLNSFPWESPFKACLYFDPTISTHYKVILVKQSREAGSSKFAYDFDIYSSGCESWKTITRTCPVDYLCNHNLVSLNGVIHLVSFLEDIHLQFRVETEEFSSSLMFEAPKIIEPFTIAHIGENDGKLILMKCYNDRGLVIYVMDERKDGNSLWILNQDFDLRQVISASSDALDQPSLYDCRFACGSAVLCAISRDASGGDLEVVLAIHDKVFCYNHQRKVTEVLCDLPPGSQALPYQVSLHVHRFIESLFPI